MDNEKRKYKRVYGVFHVRLRLDVIASFEFECISKDISEGGMRLLIEKRLLPETEVSISFDLPQNLGSLDVKGEVVWIAPSHDEEGMFETGIRFTNLEDYQRLILRKYIK